MAKRTDIHRESEMVPANYEPVFAFNLPTTVEKWPVPSLGINCELDRRREEITEDGKTRIINGEHDEPGPDGIRRCCVIGLRMSGAKFAEHGAPGNCTACGAHFIYGEVWQHKASEEFVFLGHICAEKANFFADWSEYQMRLKRLKDIALAAARREKKRLEIEDFLDNYPGLKEALEVDHHISRDLASKLQTYASLTERQIALALKLKREADAPKEERKEEHLVPAPVAHDRVVVEGVIVSKKVQPTDYGMQTKITVKCEGVDRDGKNGFWLAWGTCPRSLLDIGLFPMTDEPALRKGDRVKFQAALKPGRDSHFAFFSRPTKAERLETAPPIEGQEPVAEEDGLTW